jgi:hypothetical protein
MVEFPAKVNGNGPENILWNWRRQLLGNIGPLAVGFPFQALGIFIMWRSNLLLGSGLAWFLAGTILSATSLNWLGTYGGHDLQLQFDVWYQAKVTHLPQTKFFAGFATSKYSSLLDPHEDIGYLYLTPTHIGFLGEKYEFQIENSAITSVRGRFNPHSLLGLGGFIKIEFKVEGKNSSVLFEARSERTLLQNKREGRKLNALIKKSISPIK